MRKKAARSDRPFVSVILPTHNRSELLKNAIHSLTAQDYPTGQFEIVVVDNGATDDTLKCMRRISGELDEKVNLKYVQEERSGLVFARHTGAAHAKGDILLFGDDDAIFDSNWISAVVDVYRQHPEVGAVGTKIEIQWDCAPEPWVQHYENVMGKLDYGDQAIVRQGLYINGGSFSICKKVLLQAHGFNPGQRGDYIIGDSEIGLCRKLANAGIPVGWTPAATMWHLQQAKINGTSYDLKRRYRNNGISDAYYATFYGWTLRHILVDIWHKTQHLIRGVLSAIWHRDKERLIHYVPLWIAHHIYYLRYMWLYRFNSTIRGEVIKRDWEFSPRYKAPPIVFSHNKTYERKGDLNKDADL